MNNIGEEISMGIISSIYRGVIHTISDEFKAIFSDSGALLLIVFATMIYTVIYSVAYGSEVVRDVPIAVVDDDNTAMSRSLINGVEDGPDTRVSYDVESIDRAKSLFYSGDIFGILYIPNGYEQSIIAGEQANVSLIMDGSHLLLYSHIMQQGVADALTTGAEIEVARLVSESVDASTIPSLVEPVAYSSNTLYNPYMGYGSFVMPSILIVIIQQTMIIGMVLVAVRRREIGVYIAVNPIICVLSKILVYIIIYGVSLFFTLGIIWPIFDFPNIGNIEDIALLLLIYIVCVTSLGLALSPLFKRRESPLMLLLWSSVPVLLVAGVSYPYEAIPDWIYALGRILPSSSAVNAFIELNSMGAHLSEVHTELTTLAILAIVYLLCAIIAEYIVGKCKNMV